MANLTQTQRIILTAAAGREDGSIMPLPAHIKGGAATKVIHSLLTAGLITQMPFTITPAGRAAIAAAPQEGRPSVREALEKLTVAQITTAIAAITHEPVTAKTFNYKSKALDRLATLMEDRQLSVRDVLAAAGIEAVTPVGAALSDLGLKPDAASTGNGKTELPARKTRDDSKQAQLILMLKRRRGSRIEEIGEKFGWQAHTVRSAIAGAPKKKLGLNVISEKIEGRGRVYRIAG